VIEKLYEKIIKNFGYPGISSKLCVSRVYQAGASIVRWLMLKVALTDPYHIAKAAMPTESCNLPSH
jgi:hypothetical protein